MKTIAALLTGRGNNTLKDKNILPVLGRPLLYFPAMSAKKSKDITDFYVSSDDEKILDAAAAIGYKKIRRPDELAQPTSQHVDAILHALRVMRERDSVNPDILVVLLANSATVKEEWITEGVKTIIEDDTVSAVVPVTIDMDHHPFRAKKITRDGFLDTFFDFTGKKVSTNRQDLETCCYLCHNFWVLNAKNFSDLENGQKPWTFMGKKIKPIVVEDSFDVHSPEDILRTEKWLQENWLSTLEIDTLNQSYSNTKDYPPPPPSYNFIIIRCLRKLKPTKRRIKNARFLYNKKKRCDLLWGVPIWTDYKVRREVRRPDITARFQENCSVNSANGNRSYAIEGGRK